jgi:hypothetical protein
MQIPEVRASLQRPVGYLVLGLELLLALIVVLRTVWYVYLSLENLLSLSDSVTFFAVFINVLLTAIIGVEVARVLLTHDLSGILEILGLVLARKVLQPEVPALDILVVVVAFFVLVYSRTFLIPKQTT